MTLHEDLVIGVQCARLRDEGKEAIELAKTRPMPAFMAKSSWKKSIGARAFCGPAAGTINSKSAEIKETPCQ
jgi:hypothetical protein